MGRVVPHWDDLRGPVVSAGRRVSCVTVRALCLAYPQALAPVLPTRVVAPGEAVATVAPAVAERLGLPSTTIVCGGTTDSIAAFLAAGVSSPGQVVTPSIETIFSEEKETLKGGLRC
jgi:dTDP-4-amino-4,6-dideoxygalactose transaminase